jgi:ATP-dependent Zn protease
MFVGVGASRVRDLFKQKKNRLQLFLSMKLMP